ncbi:MAG: hypothetical protein KDB00_16510 [Planctomycetales bacterium]|nr:hypothetical protein [Planctomycetales bacterium]
MNDRNDTILPSHLNETDARASRSGEDQIESLEAVVLDVEEFARGWIGRIRKLIHRSSQLIERESLLAGAIARLDQQKAEWTKRTASKEQGLRDQSKKLTEAWLDVEAERRKAIQGARVAASAANKPNGGPVLAAPISPVSVSQPTVQPVVGAVAPQIAGGYPMPHSVPQQGGNQQLASKGAGMPVEPGTPLKGGHEMGQVQMPAASPQVNPPVHVNMPVGGQNFSIQNNAVIGNVPAHMQGMAVPNAPINAGGSTSSGEELGGNDAFGQAEAATRQRIEEFKRMQRAIRSNRNT